MQKQGCLKIRDPQISPSLNVLDVCMYLSICLSMYLSIYLPIYANMYLCICFLFPYTYTEGMFGNCILRFLGIYDVHPAIIYCKPLDSLLCREQLQKLQTLKSIRLVKKYRDSQGRKRVVGNLGLSHFLLKIKCTNTWTQPNLFILAL